MLKLTELQQQMIDQSDAIFAALTKPRKHTVPGERRVLAARRCIKSPEFEEDRRLHLDRRFHSAECLAGHCCCGNET